ncbi:hypothetical protein PGTUg99_020806 [Puccinia graminis f. sp. tritici]|uniref:Uncharacterized protein n=1 Tax=Puccinia graminis f. sp. tritici TaxID=56615 RepID=A0A5B0S4V8_PUCGR|nr:hypothetical protein PGTUg99_020806 [Puccinia graminis f. sp. tritici]
MSFTTPIDFESVVTAALAKQAKALEHERTAALNEQATHFNNVLSEIQNQMQTLSASSAAPTTSSATISNPTTSATNTTPTVSSTTKAQKTKSKPSTPLRGVRARSEPPVTLKKTPTSVSKIAKSSHTPQGTPSPPARKRHPAQLLAQEVPKDFQKTKDALFLHIRMLWGLFEQNSVPPRVDNGLLKEFYQRFASSQEVETTIDNAHAPQLISQEDILTLREGRSGRFKLGRGLANVDEMHILYVHAVFGKVGIRVWGPNLEESHDSLFNSACRITALNTFRQLASSGAYQYMNIKLANLNQMSLLVSAYNHYVHYVMESRYKKELKEAGKHSKDEKKKSIQKNRERLRKSRYAYAVAKGFPKRYLRILEDTAAHSDDEFSSEHNTYIIKTLKYRSNNANIFFQRLDVEMLKADQLAGNTGRKRVRKLPKIPVPSNFTKPPVGKPIDFYHRGWFKKLNNADKRLIPNSTSVAFLPNAQFSLLPNKAPNEMLGDEAFCAKFRDVLVEPYGLDILHGNQSESDTDGGEDEGGDSIDIDQDDENKEEEEEAEAEESLFLEEGDYGDLYNNAETDSNSENEAEAMDDE